jgi:hypothetical protein
MTMKASMTQLYGCPDNVLEVINYKWETIFWVFQVERKSTADSKMVQLMLLLSMYVLKWNQEKTHYSLNLICLGQQNRSNKQFKYGVPFLVRSACQLHPSRKICNCFSSMTWPRYVSSGGRTDIKAVLASVRLG